MKYQKNVFAVIQNYVNTYHHVAPDEIFSNDSISMIGFIQNNLSPQNYIDNIFVNDYLDFLENHSVVFDKSLREKFQNEAFSVYRLLSENRKEFIQYKHKEYQQIRKERFTSYFANFSDTDVKHFIDLCLEIGNGVKQDHKRYEINSGFGMGLGVLAETRKDLFKIAVSYYLQQGDKLDLHPIPFVQMFLMDYGKEKTFTFLNELNFPSKKRWLFSYYQTLPSNQVENDDLSSLYKLFQEAKYPELPNHFDFLLGYIPLDNRIVAKVAQIILDKGDPQYSAWVLNIITNPYSDINQQLPNLFKDDAETLKKVYLTVKGGKDHDDYNSATLSKILELDPEFIVEYIEWIYAPKGEGSRWHHYGQDYSALWQHKKHREIFTRIIKLVYEKEQSDHWHTELKQFFMSDAEKRLDADVLQKQEELLTELINTHHTDIDFIEFLFEVIAFFPQERRSRLIFTFLQHNKKFIDFQRLQLESGFMSYSGSAVPVYQERIDYLKSLLPMLGSTQLLEHKVYIQQMIDSLEHQKNLEKKNDFIGHDF